MSQDSIPIHVKAKALVEKWDDGRTPEDGEPDEVIEQVIWFNPQTGEPVTDQRIIEALEARLMEDIQPE